ncbi:MAG: FixH family protein, partial [Chloroflexota bacterium]|nr:FixH family protein [Chloroflexota bacterium]
ADGAPAAAPNEVTLAANAGELLVVLTIGPTESGPAVLSATVRDRIGTTVDDATVRLRLTPPGGGAPQEVPLTARNGRYLGLGDLGREGRWRIEADVATPGGASGTAPFALDLPSGGARLLLAGADAAMGRLTSARERQTVGDGRNTVTTEYEFVAPDRLRMRVVDSGSETIAVGARRFDRAPGGQWLQGPWPEEGGYRWPRYEYARAASEVTLLGREEVDGAPCWVVAFLDTASGARYTFWIGERDSLVRWQRMYAAGHYMESRFTDFNAPIAIEAPTGP